jgi:hypothetical protein
MNLEIDPRSLERYPNTYIYSVSIYAGIPSRSILFFNRSPNYPELEDAVSESFRKHKDTLKSKLKLFIAGNSASIVEPGEIGVGWGLVNHPPNLLDPHNNTDLERRIAWLAPIEKLPDGIISYYESKQRELLEATNQLIPIIVRETPVLSWSPPRARMGRLIEQDKFVDIGYIGVRYKNSGTK